MLVRAAHHSDLLEIELSARGIPYVKYGGLRFTEAAHVKDFLAAARVVANPADDLAWFRLLRLHEGVGPVLARRVIETLNIAEPGSSAGGRTPRRCCHSGRASSLASPCAGWRRPRCWTARRTGPPRYWRRSLSRCGPGTWTRPMNATNPRSLMVSAIWSRSLRSRSSLSLNALSVLSRFSCSKRASSRVRSDASRTSSSVSRAARFRRC